MNFMSCFYLLDRNFNVITKVPTGPLRCIEICGNSIITGSVETGCVQAWNGQTGELEYKLCFESTSKDVNLIESIVSLNDYSFVCTHRKCDHDASLYLFDLRTLSCQLLSKNEISGSSRLGFLSSSSFVGVDKESQVNIYEIQSDQSLKKISLLKLPPQDIVKLTLKLNNNLFLFCDTSENINVFSLDQRKFLYKFPTQNHDTSGVTILSNTQFATVCDESCVLKIWDVNKKKCINTFKINNSSGQSDVSNLENGDLIICNFDGSLIQFNFNPLENVENDKSRLSQMCRIS